MINTFDLCIFLRGRIIQYNNISLVAVKRYIEWYQENEDFYTATISG